MGKGGPGARKGETPWAVFSGIPLPKVTLKSWRFQGELPTYLLEPVSSKGRLALHSL
jgi:hypothetical protein